MGKYAEDARQLLKLIGGRENISAVSHCMTRMRFVLNDPGMADVPGIEAMKAVKGSFTQSGQFQVIIGNTVADFYNDFVKVAGVEGVSKNAVSQAAKKNQNLPQRLVTALAEIFAPLIPAIITGGLILGFRNCIDSLYLFENGTDYKNGDKWELMETDRQQLKRLFQVWQEKMAEKGAWDALFWSNHDQPRIVSRMGSEGQYWKESAKMLAAAIHLMRGTPYIYQGEEIGMTNPHFRTIDQYRDVESLHYYEILKKNGKTEEEVLEILGARSRDNSRTPMQWTSGKNGGFSQAEPWIPMADHADRITVEAQEKEADSILGFYKKLIAVRKANPVIAEGSIAFMETENPDVLAYERCLGEGRILVWNNLTERKISLSVSREEMEKTENWKYLLGNYQDEGKWEKGELILRPYETLALEWREK